MSFKLKPPTQTSWLESWHVAPSTTQTYHFLDGIRGIAILMVVACHLIYCNPQASATVRFIFGIFDAGAEGVTVFFALSGFLISLPFWKHKSNGTLPNLRRYASRRFYKIYPPILVSICILTPIYIALNGNAPTYIIASVYWITGLAIFSAPPGDFNPVMWSLIVEMHFYIVLPLLFLLFKRVSYWKSFILTVLLFMVGPVTAKFIYGIYGMHFSLYPEIQVCFPVKLDAFAAGILVAGLYQANLMKARIAYFAPLGFLGLAIAMLALSAMSTFPDMELNRFYPYIRALVILSSGLLMAFIAKPELASRWLLNLPVLRWIGLISYEWYLFHQAPFFWTRKLLGPSDGNLLIYAGRILIPAITSLLVAALVYRWISLPILRATRKQLAKPNDYLRS